MAQNYVFTLSLTDNLTGSFQTIAGKSIELASKFKLLDDKTKGLKAVQSDLGNSLMTLREKIDLLRQERELISASDVNKIRQYNLEINKLGKEVQKLESLNGGRFKTWAKDAFNSVPYASLITNPLVALSAGLTAVGKVSMDFDKGMAKINATAQMTEPELKKLKTQLIEMGKASGTDLSQIPDAYEKILSQVNDTKLSTEILQTSLKGAKAGFTDVNVVGGALAQTLSLVGTKNYNASKVMDILFASKRVGAGEFADFARYLPPLVASGQAVNMTLEETAGLFSFMTGKGLTTEKSASALENAFTALSKSDVTDKMQKLGVTIYDAGGKMKSPLEIFSQFNQKLKGLTDQQKTNFLEKAGLTDAQARQAFVVLTSDMDKLKESLKATGNPTNELANALKNTKYSGQGLTEAWSKLQAGMLSLGNIITPIILPALDVLNFLLTGTETTVGVLVGIVKRYSDILILVGGAIAFVYGWNKLLQGVETLRYMWMMRTVVAESLLATSKIYLGVVTGGLTGAMTALNTAFMLSPIGWIIGAVALLTAGVIYAYNNFESFRGVVWGVWEAMKAVVDKGLGLLKVIGGILTLNKGLADEGRKQVMGGESVKDSFNRGFDNGVKDFKKDNAEENKLGLTEISKQIVPQPANKEANLLDFGKNSGSNGLASLAGGTDKGGKGTGIGAGISEIKSDSGTAKNLTINIQKLVEKVEIHSSTVGESAGRIKEEVTKALLAAVNDVNLAV